MTIAKITPEDVPGHVVETQGGDALAPPLSTESSGGASSAEGTIAQIPGTGISDAAGGGAGGECDSSDHNQKTRQDFQLPRPT